MTCTDLRDSANKAEPIRRDELVKGQMLQLRRQDAGLSTSVDGPDVNSIGRFSFEIVLDFDSSLMIDDSKHTIYGAARLLSAAICSRPVTATSCVTSETSEVRTMLEQKILRTRCTEWRMEDCTSRREDIDMGVTQSRMTWFLPSLIQRPRTTRQRRDVVEKVYNWC